MRSALVLLVSLLVLPACSSGQTTVLFFVRHAEKAGSKGDVPLTEAGAARAKLLARMFADVPVRGVHSTDTLRTRSTGEPTALDHELTVQLYDHKAPEELLSALRQEGGTYLVVGHSNTVPGLVNVLDGGTREDIDETIYDRLYQVVVPPRGDAVSTLLHFGAGPGEAQ